MSIELKKKKKSTNNNKNKKIVIKSYTWLILGTIFLIICILSVTYAWFNFTRTGESNIFETKHVEFNVEEKTAINLTNQYPIEESETDSRNEASFTITSHNTLTKGIRYNVYAVYGDNMSGKERIPDNFMVMKFIPPTDGDGFTTSVNNYATATSPVFDSNGKALISTGIIKDTAALTTKSYTLKLWADSSKVHVSSTTKRANNAEGNPSLADTTAGTVTATRFMQNDTAEPSIITLYPAKAEHAGKIIFTTHEYSGKFYSIKIIVEAEEAK